MRRLRSFRLSWWAARGVRLDDRGSGAGAVIIFTLVFLSLSAFVRKRRPR